MKICETLYYHSYSIFSVYFQGQTLNTSLQANKTIFQQSSEILTTLWFEKTNTMKVNYEDMLCINKAKPKETHPFLPPVCCFAFYLCLW